MSRLGTYVLIVAFAQLAGCATTGQTEAYISPPVPGSPKVVILPIQVAIERNAEPVDGGEAALLASQVEAAFAQVLTEQQRDAGHVLASGEEAKRAAWETKRWLGSLEICSKTKEELTGPLPKLKALLDSMGADTAVFVDARLHQTTTSRKIEQGSLVTLGTVATLGAILIVVAADVRYGTGVATGQMVASMVEPSTKKNEEPPEPCKEQIRLAGWRPHTFWDGSHLDLAVAVLDKSGALLWFRSGRLDVDLNDAAGTSQQLAAFME